MRRIGCLLGVFLILVAVVALFAVVVLPVIPGVGDIPILMNIQGALFCPAGQTYGHDRSSYSVRPGETFLALESYCVNEDGDQIAFTQEQDSQRLVVSALSFVIPFLIGLFLVIFSLSSAARSPAALASAASVVGRPIVVQPSPGGGGQPGFTVQRSVQTLDMSDQSLDTIKQMTGFDIQRDADGSVRIQMPGMDEAMTFNQSSDQPLVFSATSSNLGNSSGTLADRLKQLDQARDQGLLSAEEYEKLRQSILNSL